MATSANPDGENLAAWHRRLKAVDAAIGQTIEAIRNANPKAHLGDRYAGFSQALFSMQRSHEQLRVPLGWVGVQWEDGEPVEPWRPPQQGEAETGNSEPDLWELLERYRRDLPALQEEINDLLDADKRPSFNEAAEGLLVLRHSDLIFTLRALGDPYIKGILEHRDRERRQNSED